MLPADKGADKINAGVVCLRLPKLRGSRTHARTLRSVDAIY